MVMKLLNIVQANNAYFGEKDYQQYLLIKKMVDSFFLKTKIIPCPIIREPNGLALSSRNRLLSEQNYKKAPLLNKIISEKISLNEMENKLKQAGFKIDYLTKQYERIFVAAFLGKVRLIDNVSI